MTAQVYSDRDLPDGEVIKRLKRTATTEWQRRVVRLVDDLAEATRKRDEEIEERATLNERNLNLDALRECRAERDEARDLAGIAQMERDDARRQRDAAEAMLDDLNASFGAVCAERDALAANLKKVSDVVGEYGRDEDEHSPCSAFGGPLENLRVAASAVEAWMNSAKAVGQGGPYHGRWHRVSHGDDVPCFGCLLEEMFAALHVIRGGPPPARPDKPPMACSNPKGGDDDG